MQAFTDKHLDILAEAANNYHDYAHENVGSFKHCNAIMCQRYQKSVIILREAIQNLRNEILEEQERRHGLENLVKSHIRNP